MHQSPVISLPIPACGCSHRHHLSIASNHSITHNQDQHLTPSFLIYSAYLFLWHSSLTSLIPPTSTSTLCEINPLRSTFVPLPDFHICLFVLVFDTLSTPAFLPLASPHPPSSAPRHRLCCKMPSYLIHSLLRVYHITFLSSPGTLPVVWS